MALSTTMQDSASPARSGQTNGIDTPARAETDPGDKEDQYLPVTRCREQYLDYLGTKILEIEEQQIARHYYHGAQWTAEEVRILRKRRQPIITYNRVGRKINGIVGLIERLRQDPKAFPRSPKSEDGAEVATSAIRYVCESNDWATKVAECGRHASIDGLSGVELKLSEGDKGDPDIGMEIVFGDDFYYDPRSVKYDFSDARYMGVAKWLDVEDAVELFPDKEEEIRGLIESGSDLTTNADREFKWIISTEKRVRLVEHWYKYKGKWNWCFFISFAVLDEGVSPFLDEKNKTMARFIMFSAAVDHDGDRYGFVRNMKGPQDEINQRRSKALFISNSRRLIMDKGAVDSVETARTEWARPDGIIEKNASRQITPDSTTADLAAQMEFLAEAKTEIEGFANVMPAVAGEMPKNVSGRAINLLQQGGVAELGPFILAYRGWKIRVYRAIYNIIKRHWQGERWIRVTDDQQLAQFIQINGLDVDQWGRPTIVNAIGQLDVDVLLDEGPDVVNMMADTFDTLSALAQKGQQIPASVLIELAPIQGSVKRKILGMLNQPPDPLAQRGKELTVERIHSEIKEKDAGTLKRLAEAAKSASQAHLNSRQVYTADIQNVMNGGGQQQQPMPQQQPQPSPQRVPMMRPRPTPQGQPQPGQPAAPF